MGAERSLGGKDWLVGAHDGESRRREFLRKVFSVRVYRRMGEWAVV